MKNIFIVEDNPSFRLFLSESLSDYFNISQFSNIKDASSAIGSMQYALYILDLKLPDGNGLDLIDRIINEDRNAKIVILTAFGDIPTAIEAIRRGAADFIQKPVDYEELLSRMLRLTGNADEDSLNRIIGGSKAADDIRRRITSLSGSDVTVFLYGESGTGKELIANVIHSTSGRSSGKMVIADFSRIKTEFLESELFGYVKGAYSGADKSQKGKLTAADKGTIFLDNIDEADKRVQGKLLRFIETGTFYPLGSSRQEKVNARLIVSSKTDLSEAVANGDFRKDLYFRINVYPLRIPPLRERIEDIIPIMERESERIAEKSSLKQIMPDDTVLKMMLSYSWPGNVRELINYIERSIAQGHYGKITDVYTEAGLGLKEKLKNVRSETERKEIINALALSGGNKSEAARVLKISYRNLLDKIKEYGIEE